MKLAYLNWGYSHDTSIINAFNQAGIDVDIIIFPKDTDAFSIQEQIHNSGCDIVFSINFFGIISDVCNTVNVPYCCWVLELPNFDLYTKAVLNPCNYLGICDSYTLERLWQIGVGKAFYLPDAVDITQPANHESIRRGACFIGHQPDVTLNTEGMSLYGKGYLEAFIHAQRVIYGVSLLEDGLINRVWQEFMDCNEVPETILPPMQKLYIADRYIAPVCTMLEQDILLQNFENIMTIYSDGEFINLKCEKHPYVEDEQERNRIYSENEFTLVLAPRVLHDGIPRQALEVIASGGFPICGFQKDYAYFFKPDENIAYFTNSEELQFTIQDYGNHPEKRETLRQAAYQTVVQNHTYRNRIATMLDMWGKL